MSLNIAEDDPRTVLPPARAESTRGRFTVVRPHARGALGIVSVALDQELRREVALKEIQERHADNQDSRARFVLEAEITGGLEHPGIVPVYGLGCYGDGRPYYAMRLIRGESLQAAIARFHEHGDESLQVGERSVALRKLLQNLIQVCNAVEYAHMKGVLHRDLKPANIMLGEYGETLVVDWGLAKLLDQPASTDKSGRRSCLSLSCGASETQMGSAVGTPEFMSPEQAAGRLDELGAASDVYSLGATLYSLLTGRPPVDVINDPEIQAAHHEQERVVARSLTGKERWDLAFPIILKLIQQGRILRPRQVNRHIPSCLEAICLKAMALRREDRYPSPREMADDLERWLADEPVSAHREPWKERLRRCMRRHRAWTQAGAAALLAIAIVSSVAVVLVDQARRSEIRALQIEDLQEEFIRGLDEVNWTDQHLRRMDEWLEKLAELKFTRTDRFRKDLVIGFVWAINDSMLHHPLSAQDVANIENRIAALRKRSPQAADELSRRLARRKLATGTS